MSYFVRFINTRHAMTYALGFILLIHKLLIIYKADYPLRLSGEIDRNLASNMFLNEILQ